MLVNSKFALLKISLELIPEMNTLVSSAKEILEFCNNRICNSIPRHIRKDLLTQMCDAT